MEVHFSPTVCVLPGPIFGGKVLRPFTKKKKIPGTGTRVAYCKFQESSPAKNVVWVMFKP
jgi:hypothetical protein